MAEHRPPRPRPDPEEPRRSESLGGALPSPPRSLEASFEAARAAPREEGEAADGRTTRYGRHDLVHVAPAAWAALLATRPDLDGLPHLADWAEAGRPLIVRRFLPGEARGRVPLGLPLPPTEGKRRIGFALPASALAPCPAPTLDAAGAAAPPTWHPTLDDLCGLGRRFGLAPRPFGGLLWQAATGLAYLTGASDLDLLWPLPEAVVPPGLLDGLARIAVRAPMRLDGEVLLPDGAGIHWRELFDAPDDGTVLAKHLDRLALHPVSPLRERVAA